MNVYKIELMVIDHDDIGLDAVADELHNGRYGNDCISPSVMSCESRDIGEWDDSNPLNQISTQSAEFTRLFAAPPQPVADEVVTDGWPKLDRPASIGGGSFGKGVSSRLLVEAAQRKYEFEAEDRARTQEQRVKEEMNRRAMWDFVHGPIPAISKRESGK